MKFAHIADCHLGGWSDPVLGEINITCFESALQTCIEEKVDFVLISGDLFDTSRPTIEVMERTVSKIKEVRDSDIRVYVIEGSHDFSPTGKTMLRVLEKTGLFKGVSKGKETDDGKLRLSFTIDEETGTKITGLIGKMGVLETKLYEVLDRESLASEKGFKIFMFHTALTELKPEFFEYAEGMPISLLPKGFDYYAGGHVHQHGEHKWRGYGPIVFSGPTMPANFRELEHLETGGFYINTVGSEQIETEWKPLDLYDVEMIFIDASDKNPSSVVSEIENRIGPELKDKIVLLRIEGTLKSGKPTDIDLRRLSSMMKDQGAKTVKRNTNKLASAEYHEIKVTAASRDDLEEKLIAEHAGQIKMKGYDKKKEIALTKKLIKTLVDSKGPDEKKKDHQARMESNILTVFGIREEWEEFN
ncbi:MAG: DNA repair exonuclease [Candidatus Thorarchaeota archaeon]|nr:DNA repair exonuclease [Candidatus Thorarchaeota archaeon]